MKLVCDGQTTLHITSNLVFLTMTRCGIVFLVFAVNYVTGPSVRYSFKRNGLILRLTISTRTKILPYKNQGHEQIVGNIDTDLAKSPFERPSTSTGGYYILVGGSAAS